VIRHRFRSAHLGVPARFRARGTLFAVLTRDLAERKRMSFTPRNARAETQRQ
jgi:hypothetical protein